MVGFHRLGSTEVEGGVDDGPAGSVLPVNEGDGGAVMTGAAGTANPVQVRLIVLGALVVNDVGDVVDVDTAGGHVRGDENIDLAGTEGTQCALAGTLTQVAVQGTGGKATLFEFLGNAGGLALRAGKDDGKLATLRLEDPGEHLDLVELVGAVNDLCPFLSRSS